MQQEYSRSQLNSSDLQQMRQSQSLRVVLILFRENMFDTS